MDQYLTKCARKFTGNYRAVSPTPGALVHCRPERDPEPSLPRQLTYRDSGVDIDAGAELIRRIGPATKRTRRPEMLSGLGGFAALARLPDRYQQPVLVTGTDGVGTKLKLAIDNGRHQGVGQDLVAMCANDVLVTGAEPFLFLDYYATARLDVDVAEQVINGIARACEMAGCGLAGGETAEMPGFYQAGDYDLAGFCIGVVEEAEIISGQHIDNGHALVGLASSGPHSNGYSLIRRILVDQATPADGELLDTLLTPTRIYAQTVQEILSQVTVHGMAHITGGGLLENLPRMFSADAVDRLGLMIELDAWQRPAIFSWLQQAGNLAEDETLRTFNCGIGFVLCVADADVAQVIKLAEAHGDQAMQIGRVVETGTPPTPGQLYLDANGTFQRP
jgi:phosphoribosylformylglycinamidine cyclo-ligase